MTSALADERFVWVDTETFGLDYAYDPIIEVGFTITDLDLEVIDSDSWLMWTDGYQARLNDTDEDDFVMKMHTQSGLWEACRKSGLDPSTAETLIGDWLEKHKISTADPMCGSSVQFDRGMFDAQMPSVSKFFSYRNIDISTLKELCRRLNPDLYAKLDSAWTQSQKMHRVLPDLEDTISEYRFYQENFLFVAGVDYE